MSGPTTFGAVTHDSDPGAAGAAGAEPEAARPLLRPLPEGERRVLIAGYYGWRNTGDEAILAALVGGLRARRPGLGVAVVSGNPEETRRSLDVDAVHWLNMHDLIAAASACDLIVLGGGGLFQDYWGVDTATTLTQEHWGMSFFAAFPLLASLLGKPMIVCAAGVGPLRTGQGRQYTRLIFQQAQAATVRDRASRDLVLGLGVSEDRVSLSADLAYLLTPAGPERIDAILREAGIDDSRPLVGVALRHWGGGEPPGGGWMAEAAGALERFAAERQVRLVFIPFQTLVPGGEDLTDDGAAARRVRGLMREGCGAVTVESALTPAEVLGLLGRCAMVFGMRLHSVVLAALARVPAAALCYDPKVRQAMEQLGLARHACGFDDVSSGRLAALLASTFDQREALRAQLDAAAPGLVEAARSNLDLILAWLDAGAAQLQANDTPETIAILKRLLLDHTRRLQTYSWRDETQRQQLASRQAEIEDLTRQLAEVRENLREARQTHHEVEERIAELRAREAAQARSATALGAALAVKNDEILRLGREAAEQRETLARYRQLLSETAGQLGAGNQSLLDLSARFIERAPAPAARKGFQRVVPRSIRRALRDSPRTVQILAQPGRWTRRIASLAAPAGLRRALRDFRAQPSALAVKLAGRLYELIVPRRLRLALRDALVKREMSWYAYAFDLYKRARAAAYGPALDGVRTPAEPGLVSVVLPVFNGEDMIAQAIETVLNQTYSKFELIVINDGSKDGTGAIIDRYARQDPRVRAVHQENRKIPRTLSRGFRLARGEYLTWTSCDNYFKPEFLEKMVAELERHPCWDMVYANLDIIGDDGRPLRDSAWYRGYQRPPGSEHIHLPADTSELNTWPNNFVGAAFLYRSRVAYLAGDYSRFRFTIEDYDYWMRVNSLFALRHASFDEPVYDYRFHEKSLTARDEELGITRGRDRLMIFDDFRRDFYLSPAIWIIDEDEAPPEEARRAAAQLRGRLRAAGHLLHDGSRYGLDELPRLWAPRIHARITSRPAEAAPPRGAFNGLRALIAAGDASLPAEIGEAWDLGIALGRAGKLPRLERDYQGWLGARDVAAAFASLDIRAKEDHLRRIEAEIEDTPAPTLRASVVICTYRYNERLANAIRSAIQQSMPRAEYEILIVNNNPANTAVAGLVDQLRAGSFGGHPGLLRLIVCPIPGLSAARNAGIAEARGEVLCFLDDDAVAEPDWLERICAAFAEHPEAGVVGGPITLKIPEPRPRALKPGWEKYWSELRTGHTAYTELRYWWEFPWGANWSARRKALLAIGGFRTRYGRRGNDYWGGEEMAAANLIQRAGFKIAFEPAARVLHDVDPGRFTFAHVRRTMTAGELVNYLLQRDLYIPMETTLGAAIARTLFSYSIDPALVASPPVKLWDMLARKSAHARLLRLQLADRRARLRTPAVREPLCEERRR